jgi:ATP-dependent protease ClpP protease subunit
MLVKLQYYRKSKNINLYTHSIDGKCHYGLNIDFY